MTTVTTTSNKLKNERLKVKGTLLFIFLSLFTFHLSPLQAQISMPELSDSLFAYTGFSRVWSAPVRVKNMRVSGNKVVLYTNGTLRDYRWTLDNIVDIKRKVSLWTLGHTNGQVTIYSSNTDIETLITECAKSQIANGKCPKDKCDLTDKTIALYPSHGLYFNRDRNEWIWQRATLWTTVEDLYSHEYVRLIKRMLENAGATVLMPRAGLDEQEPGVSGMPRWVEGARYWMMNQGADSTLWDLYGGNEYKDDMKCRAMWVNAQQSPIDLCLAFHTDGNDSGNDSTVIGTLAIYTAKDDEGQHVLRDGRNREKTNRNLADWIQTQITKDLRHIAPEWTRRQLKESNYCESRVPVVPSMILELLSHKNMADMRYGLDPKFRFAAARAVYKGILRYLNGANATVQPLPVQDLGIGTDGVLRWKTVTDSIEPSATPTYYMVYIQANDGEWDVQQVENATELQLELQPGVRYNYYVIAGNEGGLSYPSPIVSAYINEKMVNDQMVLVVDGFNDVYGPEWFADSTYAGIVPGSYACEDRFSCAYIGEVWNYTRSDEWKNDDNCGWGSCYRDHAGQFTIGNTHDYTALHGRVLQQMGISYVSCTAEMIEMERKTEAPEFDFQLMDIICGRQRQPISETLANAIEIYTGQVGKLLLSTDHFSAIEPKWAKQYLHAQYYAAQATHSGKVKASDLSPFTFHLYLTPNDTQLFTDHPEALKPEADAVRIASYEDMRVPAAVGYKSALVFGFPLETVQEFDKIYQHAIEWLMKE